MTSAGHEWIGEEGGTPPILITYRKPWCLYARVGRVRLTLGWRSGYPLFEIANSKRCQRRVHQWLQEVKFSVDTPEELEQARKRAGGM